MNIADLFSNLNYNNYSQIKQNPTSVVRTPIQEAYDNLLNREYEINKQNKTNNLVNGLMSGMGGLGKIIASSVVKNPMQQYGAMKGLTEQEGRIDNLQQAYNQARQKQNQDYVQQAKEQLGLATAEDDRKFNREQTALDRAYQKTKDELAQKNYEKEQEIKAQQRAEDVAFRNQQAAAQARQQEIANKHWEIQDAYARDKAEQDRIQRQFDNDLSLMDRNIKEQEAIKKAKEEEDKAIKQEIKSFNDKGSIDTETYLAINKDTELRKYLKPKKDASGGINVLGTTITHSNPNTYELDYEAILKDQNIPVTKKNLKELKKQLGV